MDLANLYDERIAHLPGRRSSSDAEIYRRDDGDIAESFMSLLSQPARLGELLRRLHELERLEKIIPAFRSARYLLQFNEYHKYTVDEHCILIRRARHQFASPNGPLGSVYRHLKRKRTLHLALLLHDLGRDLPGTIATWASEIAERNRDAC